MPPLNSGSNDFFLNTNQSHDSQLPCQQNSYRPSNSITVVEIVGVQGLSGPPGPPGPPGPQGIPGVLQTHSYYTRADVLLLLKAFKGSFKFHVPVVEEPDGMIHTFTINNDTFVPETLKVYINGLRETGFTIIDDHTFSIESPYPEFGDTIWVEYISQKDFDLLNTIVAIPEIFMDEVSNL